MTYLDGLLANADDLRVDAIAQPPFVADIVESTPAETFRAAVERGFDLLPVRDRDRRIRAVVQTSSLDGVERWQDMPDPTPLKADDLVARDAPIFSLLDRFGEREILFCLGRRDVDGVVTIFDLNQPPAHLFAFGLILLIESELTDLLEAALGADPARVQAQVARVITHSKSLNRWRGDRDKRRELHLVSYLALGEKVALAHRICPAAVADGFGLSRKAVARELTMVTELRNAIGHYTLGKLSRERWTWERMRVAHALAQRIVDRRRDRALK